MFSVLTILGVYSKT